jgi:chromatin remodeling complex protein RSC6
MSSAAKSAPKAAKVVAKKEAAAPVVVAVAAPAPAAEAKAPKAKKAAVSAAAAPVVVAATPVEQAKPAEVAAPLTTLEEDLKVLTASLTTLRETATSLLGQVKRLDRRVHREIKDARKRKRRVKVEEGAEAKPRVPSIFERPVQVTDELCKFLAKPNGTLLSRSEVTKLVNNYVKEKDLKTKHAIAPDAALKKLLAIPEGDQLTYFNLQKYLNRHYVKTEKAAVAAVKA